MSEQHINGTNRIPQAPGLPRSERPHQHIYLVRRKTDGTHWLLEAMSWSNRQVVLIDYKNPAAPPVEASFDDIEVVDKKPLEAGEDDVPLIVPGR